MPTLSPLVWITRPASHLLRDLAETCPNHPAACLLPRLADVVELAGIENDGEALATLLTEETRDAFHRKSGKMIDLAAQGDPCALGTFLLLFPDVDQVVINKTAPAADTPAPSRKARRAALSRSAKREKQGKAQIS